MTGTLKVFVNARPIEVPVGATVLHAVRALDPAAAEQVRSGERLVLDDRGLPIAVDATLHGGSILRLSATRRRDA